MRRNSRLFTLLLTIAIWLHTVKLHAYMLWLTLIMRKPAIARRIIAIELLRRMDQLNLQRRRASFTYSRSLCYFKSPHCNSQFRTSHRHPDDFLASTRTTTEHYAMGRAACDPSLTSRISIKHDFNNLRHLNASASLTTHNLSFYSKSEINLPRSPLVPDSSLQVSSATRQHQDKPQIRLKCSREIFTSPVPHITPPASPFSQDHAPRARHSFARGYSLQSERRQQDLAQGPQSTTNPTTTPPRSEAGSVNGHASSAAQDRKMYSQPKTPSAKYHDDTTEGANERASRTSIDSREDEYVENQRTHVRRHRRNISTDSVSTTVRRSTPVTLRSRSKANGGLLELKANGARTQEITPSRAHRRNLSLKMPIRLSSPQPTDSQQALKRLSSLTTSSSHASPTKLSPTGQTAAELHYKQRHIFVGTASLSTFLGSLETSPFGYTTRLSIMRAFTLLASKEQQLARQRSSSHEDWNLVSRITPETSDFDDFIVLARVQLGSVSLQRFVDSIPFGEGGEASLVAVVEAFKNAAHVDAQEEGGKGGEALAFKRWLLGHGQEVEGSF